MAFSSHARIWGECSTIHSLPVPFFLSFEVEISLSTFLYLCQDQSTVAQRAETTVAEWSLTSCMWARSGQVPTLCLDSGIFSPHQLRWDKGVCMFRCYLSSSLLAVWPGSFTCHCGNTGVEWTPNKNQHTKLTQEKKILPPLLPGFELATFRSRFRRSTKKLPRPP